MIKEFLVLFSVITGGSLARSISIYPAISNVNRSEYSSLEPDDYTDLDNKLDNSRSSPTFTYFNGTATNIYIGSTATSYFYYTGQHVYFRFHSLSREYLSLNYSGPTANLTIYYSNFFLSSDYLTSITNVGSAIDCYYFDKDAEYILDFSPSVYVSYTVFSFKLETLDLNMQQHEKYVLHQTIDSSSNVGFHYQTEFYNVNTSSSSSTYAYINNYAPSGGTYLDLIDSQTYFYNPADYTFADNRRLVYDTGYDEYSSVAYCSTRAIYNSYTTGYDSSNYYRGSGTFVSPTTVISCAHMVYPEDSYVDDNKAFHLVKTGLNNEISFEPGINTYTSENYYGKYVATEIYASISYILAWNHLGKYSPSCAEFDWCIYLTSNSIAGTRTHSYMGFAQFSYPSSLDYWSHASNAGYPKMDTCPTNMISSYRKAMWASYPLQEDVVLNGNVIDSENIITSGGNSGGPLYYKTSSIYQGQLVVNSNLIGICSGGTNYSYVNQETVYKRVAHFCRMTHLIVNMIKTIASIS